MFERSTDKEWHNPTRTFSNGRDNPLEKICRGVGNTKTRRTLCQQLTIIYSSMFRQLTVAGDRERDRDRERESVRVYKQTQRDTHLPALRTLFLYLIDWLLFQYSLIFIYSNSGYRWGWCHLAELLSHLSRVQNSRFFLLQSNMSQTRYESILFTFWPSCVKRYILV